jgi:hypothetical protein
MSESSGEIVESNEHTRGIILKILQEMDQEWKRDERRWDERVMIVLDEEGYLQSNILALA